MKEDHMELRGVDRNKTAMVELLARHRYQPPPTCSHARTYHFKRMYNVKGLFRECRDCHLVVGVIGTPSTHIATVEVPVGPPVVVGKLYWYERLWAEVVWLCSPPDSWVRWYRETF